MTTDIGAVNSIAVKGCIYIYAPKGQAFEYAPLATNPYRGCGHICSDCCLSSVQSSSPSRSR